MDAVEFLRTIYLGDRAVKSILIESWASRVGIQIDCISRVRGDKWNYYTDEDISDGWIVLEGVTAVEFQPSGPLPNDYVNDFGITVLGLEAPRYRFHFSVGSGSKAGETTEVRIYVNADDLYLRDPRKPDMKIQA
jgi:hypothetical protein